MPSILGRLLSDKRAATAIEYAFVAALISIAAIGPLSDIGQKLVSLLGPAASALH